MADTDTGTPAAPESTPQSSVGDDLRAVIAESIKANTPAEETTEAPPEEADAEPKAERARGPDGKFLPKEASEDGPPEAPAEPEGEAKPKEAPEGAETPDEAQKPAETAPKGAEPPLHWPQADKQWLASLPVEHQASVLQRFKQMEAGFTPKMQKLGEYERNFQGIPEMFAPHTEALKAQGKTPAQVIQTWASIERGLGTPDAPAIIARMIAGYKVNPAAVADVLNGLANGQQPPMQQPVQAALPPELLQKIERLEQDARLRTETENQRALDTAQRQIDTFANEKTAEGDLKHPFFADVEDAMMQLAQVARHQGRSLQLDDLYDSAVWANPETRTKLRQLETERDAKRAAVERKAKADAAKRASVSTAGSPGATAPAAAQRNSNASVEDDVRAAWEQATGA